MEWDTWSLDEGLRFVPDQEADVKWSDQEPLHEYRAALLAWASRLLWPVRPAPVEQTSQVTYIELFMHFTVCSNLLPPVSVSAGKKLQWFFARSPEGSQFTRTAHKLVADFVGHVNEMSKTLKRDLWIASEVPYMDRLGPLGMTSRCTGLDARPQLWDTEIWVPELLLWLRDFQADVVLRFVLNRNNGEPVP